MLKHTNACIYVCIYYVYIIYNYIIFLHELECEMVKKFKSRLHEPDANENKPESKISCHITLINVAYSTLDILTAVVCTRTGNSQCKVGCRGSPDPKLTF